MCVFCVCKERDRERVDRIVHVHQEMVRVVVWASLGGMVRASPWGRARASSSPVERDGGQKDSVRTWRGIEYRRRVVRRGEGDGVRTWRGMVSGSPSAEMASCSRS